MVTPLIHLDCKGVATPVEVPDDHIPEADRHGNTRTTYVCQVCGEESRVVFPKFGSNIPENGWRFADDLEWDDLRD